MRSRYDVVIVGAGNAAFCAAHAAAERGRRVLMLEKAPREWAGGNSYFTAGAMRTTYDGLDDLRPVLEDLSDEEAARTELPPYTPRDFMADMRRVTEGRCDEKLVRIMADEAADTVRWLHEKGLRFRLMYDRQSYEVDGKRRFWGGLVLGTVGGGKGLINQHAMAARKSGIGVRYGSAVRSLLGDGREGVRGVVCEEDGELHEIGAGAVVLAGGGFESDARMRAQYLGPNWDVAKVRGTPYNTGEVLMSAIEAGAQPYGNWSGCHSIAWDAAAPPTGDRELTNLLSKQSYPLGIVVNGEARRRWNTSFSPLEVGKHWCYGELAKVAPVHTVPGYVTKTLRDAAGLHKSGAKLSDRWDTHCVDAFVLANAAVGGSGRPTSTQMLHVVPLQFHRRQLHRFTLGKGGQRTPYGGTRSLGLKRGSWVTHPRYGLGFVGGTLHGRISLHSLETGKRLTQHARVEECRMLCTASWRIRSGRKPGSGVSPIVGAPPRAEGPGFPRVKARAL